LTGEFAHSIEYTRTEDQIANGLTKVIAPIDWPKMLTQLCLEDFMAEVDTQLDLFSAV